MKKDYYFPHEIRIRNDEAVMELIEFEGASGYGIYWALIEYLRTQEGYVGKMVAVKNIARQMRTKPYKVESVLKNYGLFMIADNTFRSAKLENVMKPLDNKYKKMEARKADTTEAMPKQHPTNTEAVEEQCSTTVEAAVEQEIDNSLNINIDSCKNMSIIKENKVKKSKEYTTTPISSSSAEAVEVAAEVLPISFVPAWERYVNELQEDEQWKELVAMRSGLKEKFSTLFPRIVEAFKRHVRSIGNEGQILSPGDAKHYFWFFMSPSSPTYKNLILELQKPLDRGKYKHEDYDPVTGQRSYCGVQIPADAPPRPNGQAVWCDGKWSY